MVRPREGSFAQPTLERPIARVLPIVAGQLIGSREPPSASLPVANVGFLARVRPLVGLQMARLGVGLDAALDRTRVDDGLALGPISTLTRSFGGFGGGDCQS